MRVLVPKFHFCGRRKSIGFGPEGATSQPKPLLKTDVGRIDEVEPLVEGID